MVSDSFRSNSFLTPWSVFHLAPLRPTSPAPSMLRSGSTAPRWAEAKVRTRMVPVQPHNTFATAVDVEIATPEHPGRFGRRPRVDPRSTRTVWKRSSVPKGSEVEGKRRPKGTDIGEGLGEGVVFGGGVEMGIWGTHVHKYASRSLARTHRPMFCCMQAVSWSWVPILKGVRGAQSSRVTVDCMIYPRMELLRSWCAVFFAWFLASTAVFFQFSGADSCARRSSQARIIVSVYLLLYVPLAMAWAYFVHFGCKEKLDCDPEDSCCFWWLPFAILWLWWLPGPSPSTESMRCCSCTLHGMVFTACLAPLL